MKSIKMKGKSVEEATKIAIEVLGVKENEVKVRVINEGKPGMMGILGGEEAEVEIIQHEAAQEEAKQILQTILDKMGFMAMVQIDSFDAERVSLSIKGDDMGRIIGKDGNCLKSLEVLVRSILWKSLNQKTYISIDAGGYREKREKSLERLAADVVDEVILTGKEKVLPPMAAADRRIIHMYIKDNVSVASHSEGEGADRRLIISPK